MKLKPKIKERWLEALRSGNYKQTQEKLRDSAGYCCLGVLCDIHAKEYRNPWSIFDEEDGWLEAEYLGSETTLPDEVMDWVVAEFGDQEGLPQPQLAVPASAVSEHPNYDSMLGGGTAREDKLKILDLARLNDEARLTFEQLADLIEEYL